jgi:hypothetical protein
VGGEQGGMVKPDSNDSNDAIEAGRPEHHLPRWAHGH